MQNMHTELFEDVPVSIKTTDRWAIENMTHLNGAARAIVEYKANPWVFTLDPRGFHQFARAPEYQAILAMTWPERNALLGKWHWSDWDCFRFEEPQLSDDLAELARSVAELGLSSLYRDTVNRSYAEVCNSMSQAQIDKFIKEAEKRGFIKYESDEK